MAKTPASTLITNILKAMGLNPGVVADGSVERVDALRFLNTSNQEILTEHSLRFMLTPAGSTLAVVASACAVPATVDPSKTMTLGRVSGDGEIIYVEVDAWFREGVDTYGQGSAQIEPTLYTVIGSTFVFKPAGLTATVPYIAQLRVTALTDGASESQLPEGWENTLLAIDAEAEFRRYRNQAQWENLKARANTKREALYASERTSKEVPKTDREQKERAISKKQLSDEAEG